jgi:hypothetical protein
MAITKTLENDKIEIIMGWQIQVRQATIIKEDGVEINRTFHRTAYTPFTSDKDSDGNWTHTVTDISELDADVQAYCNLAWSDANKTAYKTWVEAQG